MLKKLSYLILLVSIASLYACNIDSDAPFAPEDTSGNNDDNGDGDNSAFATEMLAAVNQLRTDGCTCGTDDMPPVANLTWNNQLETAAIRHTTDMDDNDHFSHTGTDNSSVGQRVSDAGYNWSTVGENIARGQPSVEAVVEAWKNSTGHCKNMMGAGYTEMGVASVGIYWTQVFAAQ